MVHRGGGLFVPGIHEEDATTGQLPTSCQKAANRSGGTWESQKPKKMVSYRSSAVGCHSNMSAWM
jgi:hypothetical protein